MLNMSMQIFILILCTYVVLQIINVLVFCSGMVSEQNIHDIITLVDAQKLEDILRESDFHEHDPKAFQFIIYGFRHGFSLEFEGNHQVKQKSPNLKFTIGDKWQLWSKVIKEVKLKCYAGPFKDLPFEYFVQSPIGLVP